MLYSSRTGFLSGLILATSLELLIFQPGPISIHLTFTTAALFCFFYWYKNMKEGRFLIYGFYVGMALGTLTKGPVGF
jgi:4-amino-4-deoxy-L-arabinose transferase-like glycosyltransferase